jgi:autotransporter adhesin
MNRAFHKNTIAINNACIAAKGNVKENNEGIDRYKKVLAMAALASGFGPFAALTAYAGATDGGTVSGTNPVAVGPGSNATGFATAVGFNANAAGIDTTAMGNSSNATTSNDSAYGHNSSATGGAATAIGSGAAASGFLSAALGTGANATASQSVALGTGSVADRTNTISVGSATSQRQVVNMANGTADTDAVNVSQLKGVTAAMGGGATVNADGTVAPPSYTVGGTTVSSIGDAISSLDQLTTANTNAISSLMNAGGGAGSGSQDFQTNTTLPAAQATGADSIAIGGNSRAQADNSVAIGANSVADRANTVSVGAQGSERQIVNVAAGTEAMDAVNVSQLNAAIGSLPPGMSAKDYTDSRFNEMQNSVNQVAKNAYAGVAAAMAMPNLTPSQPGRTIVAAGGGFYKSGSAAAVGVTYRSENGHWLTNGAIGVTSTGDAGGRVQIGYEF